MLNNELLTNLTNENTQSQYLKKYFIYRNTTTREQISGHYY